MTYDDEMHYEEWVTIYTKMDEKKLREALLHIGQPATSEVNISYYNTKKVTSTNIAFDVDDILRYLNDGADCSWGVAMDEGEYEGYSLSFHKESDNVVYIGVDVLITGKNEMMYLERIKEIYNQLSPEVGASANEKGAYIMEYYERPEYFEWVLILGPRLAEYIDKPRVPEVYEIIDMKDGGMIIHEDIFKRRASGKDMDTILEMIPEDLSFLWK